MTLDPEVDLKQDVRRGDRRFGRGGRNGSSRPDQQGMKVLLLEAGKKLNIEQELRSMEWPYDNAHRGFLPPDSHALSFNEYTIRQPPYGPGFERSKHLHSYIGSTDYAKNIVVDERENPYTGTNYAWVRARCLGGKTNIWGRLGAAPVGLRLQSQETATATAKTGRSATATSRRTTTRSICISALRASKRICRTCPTAFFSGRPN